MIIIKNKLRDSFTQVPNQLLEDERLSWKAKGLLSYLIGKPTDWSVRKADLISRSAEGETAVRNALQELEEAGYLKRERERDNSGRWFKTTYTIDFYPGGGYQHVDEQHVDNDSHSNTDISNTNNSNNISSLKEKFILGFNKIVGSKFRKIDSKTHKQLTSLLKEGYTLEDVGKAITAASKNDFLMGRDPSNEGGKRYLTPEYITRPAKFAEYLSLFEEKNG